MVAKLRSSVIKLRTSFTYANVMATIAVFLTLSGAGAYAAQKAKKLKLKPNSVASVHIKDGQVGTADLADGAVSGAKLAPGAVTGDSVLDGTLTGLDFLPESLGTDEIDESTLVVPQANDASHANNADTAAAVGNIEAQTIQFRSNGGTNSTVLSLGGLALTANCGSTGGKDLTVTATTTTDDASLVASFQTSSGISNAVSSDFNIGDTPLLISGTGFSGGDGDTLQGTMTYTAPGPQPSVVTVIYGGDEDVSDSNATACVFNGTAFHHLTS